MALASVMMVSFVQLKILELYEFIMKMDLMEKVICQKIMKIL